MPVVSVDDATRVMVDRQVYDSDTRWIVYVLSADGDSLEFLSVEGVGVIDLAGTETHLALPRSTSISYEPYAGRCRIAGCSFSPGRFGDDEVEAHVESQLGSKLFGEILSEGRRADQALRAVGAS